MTLNTSWNPQTVRDPLLCFYPQLLNCVCGLYTSQWMKVSAKEINVNLRGLLNAVLHTGRQGDKQYADNINKRKISAVSWATGVYSYSIYIYILCSVGYYMVGICYFSVWPWWHRLTLYIIQHTVVWNTLCWPMPKNKQNTW